MKTNLLATVSCLVLLAVTGFVTSQDFFQQRKSPLEQERVKISARANIRSNWHDSGVNINGLPHDPDFRAQLGISDQQYQQIQATSHDFTDPAKNPELKKVMEEIDAMRFTDNSVFESADEETKRKYFDLLEKEHEMSNLGRSITKAIEDSLTPEQNKKAKEVLLAGMLKMSSTSSNMFEALDLTETQKQQMVEIKQQLDSEFAERLENLTNVKVKMSNHVWDELEKQLAKQSDGRYSFSTDDIQAISDRLTKEYPEYRKADEDIAIYGKQFSEQFKTKMFDVLTDEQWIRLQKLIDNPPEYAKTFLNQLKEMKKVWALGPGSWKPGDPVPEEYRQQRNRDSFPRPVN